MGKISNILAVDETAVTSTPTWALLTGLGGVLVGVAFAAFGWMSRRTEKSSDEVAALKAENARLREEGVLNEVKAMRTEINATLAAIKASMERHDDEIAELRREQRASNDRLVKIEAALRKGDLLGA